MYRKDLGIDRIKSEVGWHQPFYPLLPILAMIGIVYVLYLCFYDWAQVIGFAIWFVIYLLYYFRIKYKITNGLIRKDVSF